MFPGGLVHGHDAVGNSPLGGSGAVLRGNPLVQILAVEEDDRVGRRGSAGCTRSDDLRLGLPDFGVFGLGGRLLLGEQTRRQSDKKSCDQGLSAHGVEQHTPGSGGGGMVVEKSRLELGFKIRSGMGARSCESVAGFHLWIRLRRLRRRHGELSGRSLRWPDPAILIADFPPGRHLPFAV